MRGWGRGRSSIMNERLGSRSVLYTVMNERLGSGSGSVLYNELEVGMRVGPL